MPDTLPHRLGQPLVVGVLVIVASLATTSACGDRDRRGYLRGRVQPSGDGLTYLAIDEPCGPAFGTVVDGARWPHGRGVAARVEPGTHAIDCGPLEDYTDENAIHFNVPAGVVFRFNYWGP